MCYRRGPYVDAVRQVAAALGVAAVFYSRRYEPAMQVSCGTRTKGFVMWMYNEPHYSWLLLFSDAILVTRTSMALVCQ